MKTTYFRSKDLVIAALALLGEGKFAKAGTLMMKASKSPDFEKMVTAMSAEQETAKQATAGTTKRSPKVEAMSALASIVEGMADDVNDMDDLLDDLGFGTADEIDEPEEIGVDAPGGADDVAIPDTEERPDVATPDGALTAEVARVRQAEANLRFLSKRRTAKK